MNFLADRGNTSHLSSLALAARLNSLWRDVSDNPGLFHIPSPCSPSGEVGPLCISSISSYETSRKIDFFFREKNNVDRKVL